MINSCGAHARCAAHSVSHNTDEVGSDVSVVEHKGLEEIIQNQWGIMMIRMTPTE